MWSCSEKWERKTTEKWKNKQQQEFGGDTLKKKN